MDLQYGPLYLPPKSKKSEQKNKNTSECAFLTENKDIIRTKKDNTQQEVDIQQYGLRSEHAVLLSGVNFPPSLRSAQKASLGPMAIAIILAETLEPKYQDSWKKAFVQTFKLVPNAEEMAREIAGSRGRCAPLLSGLADLALWGICRNSNKFFPPIAMFHAMVIGMRDWKTNEVSILNGTRCIADNDLPACIRHLNFSGAGAFGFWNWGVKRAYSMNTSEASERTLREMVFHAAWGSQKENLELLEWMTGHVFQTRREIGTQLQGRMLLLNPIRLPNLIPIRYCSKLCSAAQTQYITGGSGQIARNPTFSGRHSIRIDLGSELVARLENDRAAVAGGGRTDMPSLLLKITELKRLILEEVRDRNELMYGTTSFHEYHETTEASQYGQEIAGPRNLGSKISN